MNEAYLPSKHFGEKIVMKSSQEGVSVVVGEDEFGMIEEERRLCYVAMTRAEHQLILSTFSEEKGVKCTSSRFLEEISQEQCEFVNKIPKENPPVYIKQNTRTFTNSVDKNTSEPILIKKIEVEQLSQLPPILRPQKTSPIKSTTKVSPQTLKSPTNSAQFPSSHLPNRQMKITLNNSPKKKIDFLIHNSFTSGKEVSEESADYRFQSEDKDPDEIIDDDEEDGNTEKESESGPTVDDLAAMIDSEDSPPMSGNLARHVGKKPLAAVKDSVGPVGLSKLMDSRVRLPGLRRTNKRRHSTGTELSKSDEFEPPPKKQKTSLGHSKKLNKDR